MFDAKLPFCVVEGDGTYLPCDVMTCPGEYSSFFTMKIRSEVRWGRMSGRSMEKDSDFNRCVLILAVLPQLSCLIPPVSWIYIARILYVCFKRPIYRCTFQNDKMNFKVEPLRQPTRKDNSTWKTWLHTFMLSCPLLFQIVTDYIKTRFPVRIACHWCHAICPSSP